jgi:hypothetical protein
MFQVTLFDHVRLSFASALAAYEAHAEAAAKLARWNSYAKLILLSLSGLATVSGVIATQTGFGWQVLTALLAAATFATCAAYVSINQQPLMYGHRVSASKLWVICEKYRALLAEMHEERIDLSTLQQRRNELINETAAVLEQAAPDDRYTFEIAKEALSGPKGAGYPDWLIDRYLPESLRKGSTEPPAVPAPEATAPPHHASPAA